jgi:adenylate cyclase
MEPEAAGKVIGEKRPRLKQWQWLVPATAVAVVLAVAAVWYFSFRPAIEPASVEKMAFPLPDKPSIAVLPFDNLSGDPEQEYIADGIVEAIITALSRVSDMFVIARTSTFTYKGKPVKIKQVSEELGVRYVLEGSVQKEGDRVRITAQLIDAIEGHHLWAEQYDRDMKDYFDLLNEITKEIGAALQVELTWGEQARLAACTENFEVWSYITRAYNLYFRHTSEDMAKARELCERALQLEPENVCAYATLAAVHFYYTDRGSSESRAESFKRAVELLQKGLAIDEEHPAALSLIGGVYLYPGDYDKAIAERERAITIDPNFSLGYVNLGYALYCAGRPEESIEFVKKGMRLSPYYPPYYLTVLARSYLMAGRYEEAITADKLLIDRWKKQGGNITQEARSHVRIAEAWVELNRMDDARAHAAEVLKMDPKFSLERWRKRHPYKDPAHLEHRIQALRKAGLK